MILIIGGAYQGKLAYAKETYNLKDEDICDVKEGLDLQKKCLYHGEYLESIDDILDDLKDKIIIFEDIFCGLVPIDKELRLNREKKAIIASALARQADKVIRIYLSIPEVLKWKEYF